MVTWCNDVWPLMQLQPPGRTYLSHADHAPKCPAPVRPPHLPCPQNISKAMYDKCNNYNLYERCAAGLGRTSSAQMLSALLMMMMSAAAPNRQPKLCPAPPCTEPPCTDPHPQPHLHPHARNAPASLLATCNSTTARAPWRNHTCCCRFAPHIKSLLADYHTDKVFVMVHPLLRQLTLSRLRREGVEPIFMDFEELTRYGVRTGRWLGRALRSGRSRCTRGGGGAVLGLGRARAGRA